MKAGGILTAMTIFGIITFPHSASGAGTVSEMLELYDEEPTSQKTLEDGLLQIATAYMRVNSYLKLVKGEEQLFCPPSGLDLSGPMLVGMLRGSTSTDSARRDVDLYVALLLTLTEIFPCPEISN